MIERTGYKASKRGESLSDKRIIHSPRQVLDVSEIVPGAKFEDYYYYVDPKTGQFQPRSESRVVIQGKPYVNKSTDSLFVRVRKEYKDSKGELRQFETEISLADRGITPYKEDVWNSKNYLERTNGVSDIPERRQTVLTATQTEHERRLESFRRQADAVSKLTGLS